MAVTETIVTELPDVDATGNIQVNSQGGINIICEFLDDTTGVARDVSLITHYFRVKSKLNILLLPTSDPTQKQLLVSQADVALLGSSANGIAFAVVEAGTPDQVMWEGLVYPRGFAAIPALTT